MKLSEYIPDEKLKNLINDKCISYVSNELLKTFFVTKKGKQNKDNYLLYLNGLTIDNNGDIITLGCPSSSYHDVLDKGKDIFSTIQDSISYSYYEYIPGILGILYKYKDSYFYSLKGIGVYNVKDYYPFSKFVKYGGLEELPEDHTLIIKENTIPAGFKNPDNIITVLNLVQILKQGKPLVQKEFYELSNKINLSSIGKPWLRIVKCFTTKADAPNNLIILLDNIINNKDTKHAGLYIKTESTSVIFYNSQYVLFKRELDKINNYSSYILNKINKTVSKNVLPKHLYETQANSEFEDFFVTTSKLQNAIDFYDKEFKSNKNNIYDVKQRKKIYKNLSKNYGNFIAGLAMDYLSHHYYNVFLKIINHTRKY